ncbi:hypothetical protein TBLA_0B01570 [Henningerozyma blattae CBS 6284]|uniref:FAD-binding FR-type domain-containing protein n=1 Tax=Henningerozyma blattae (strain ATCC 34711 / CBS 6284 / DSM 70876 / NBRC 10599 / NRRL Y-10934 / UCD 77-7) TaxID=1071380 RepID=I2GXZ8_HENB6|nr:hypothetical protein TBLA_0B01570 [Tetrapisispora blattae CBS 6284]CCH59000.1 hypothetical protein TBLA_0B01570 [Tetrapisispora blattae CBS 6284]
MNKFSHHWYPVITLFFLALTTLLYLNQIEPLLSIPVPYLPYVSGHIILNNSIDPFPVPLKNKTEITKDIYVYAFTLPHSQDILGTKPGQFITVTLNINVTSNITRPYAVLSSDKGEFELLIQDIHHGGLSTIINHREIDSIAYINGPYGNYKYEQNFRERIGIVASSTGLSAVMPIIHQIVYDKNDTTYVNIVYLNKSGNILLKDRLDGLVREAEGKLTVTYVTDISDNLLIENFNWKDVTSKQLLICGSPFWEDKMIDKFVNLLDFERPNERNMQNEIYFY